jgi:hypothetical protein
MPPRLIDDNVRQAALGILETAGEIDEWDIAPTIVLVAETADKPACIPVPIPTTMWFDKHPAAVLHGIAYGVSNRLMRLQLAPPITPDDIRGVILFTEGHDVSFDALTPAEQTTFEDFKARHRLEEHPKARELRMAQMMDRALTPALARHVRGEAVSDQIIYGLQGRIPDALSRVVTAILAAWIGEAEKTN